MHKLVLVAVLALGTAGDFYQTWTAVSRTAESITGDIVLMPTTLTMVHQKFPLTLVREIDKQHLNDAGKVVDFLQPPSAARLYKTQISSRAKLLNGNTICGPVTDAKWLLAVYDKDQLSLAFFSGNTEPNLDPKAVAVSHDLCGTYSYVGPDK